MSHRLQRDGVPVDETKARLQVAREGGEGKACRGEIAVVQMVVTNLEFILSLTRH
jgi:hypothetical protein